MPRGSLPTGARRPLPPRCPTRVPPWRCNRPRWSDRAVRRPDRRGTQQVEPLFVAPGEDEQAAVRAPDAVQICPFFPEKISFVSRYEDTVSRYVNKSLTYDVTVSRHCDTSARYNASVSRRWIVVQRK
jgi:hypothetical protein